MFEDAPELSGHTRPSITGNEPVLKGVNSRVLADRRGAYVTGNLEALTRMMTNAQRSEFKHWNVRMTLRWARRALPLFEDVYPNDNIAYAAVIATRAWVESPTEANRQAAAAAARRAPFVTKPYGASRAKGNAARDALRVALCAAQTAGAIHGTEIITRLAAQSRASAHTWITFMETNESPEKYHREAVIRVTQRAQLRAAYLILLRSEQSI